MIMGPRRRRAPSLPDGLIVPEARHTDAEELTVANDAAPFPPIRNRVISVGPSASANFLVCYKVS